MSPQLAPELDPAELDSLGLNTEEGLSKFSVPSATAAPATEIEPETITYENIPDSTLIADLPVSRLRADEEEDLVERRDAIRQRWAAGLDWANVIWLGVVHLGALSALFFFTWKAVAIMAVLGWLTGGIGICLSFHRGLTHGSFQTSRPMRWLLAFIGGLAGEGSALTWVAVHRKHHLFSDQAHDPHSPRDGKWWSHILWLGPRYTSEYKSKMIDRYARDLNKDPVMRFLDKTFLLWHIVLGVVLYAVGSLGWDSYTGWSFVAWGLFIRMLYVLHATWFVNSATHIWGYRNYETTDDSRNLWWVALVTYGEGWHNNHHAFQRMANYGHKWWEFDITYQTIRLMEKVGLVWNVVHHKPHHERALKNAARQPATSSSR
ncbi:MAG: acyl-CoA desaturase [Pirellulales bacterium]